MAESVARRSSRRAAVPSLAAEYLIDGEKPDTPHIEDARQWTTIYTELVTFHERALERTHRAMAVMSKGARSQLAATDEAFLQGHLWRLRQRLAFWQGRLWDLGGLDFDRQRRALAHRGKQVALTRRESELVGFMLSHPSQYYTAEQLLVQAWHAPDLSPEQVRSYIVRVRRIFNDLAVPCRLVSEVGRGYSLVFVS